MISTLHGQLIIERTIKRILLLYGEDKESPRYLLQIHLYLHGCERPQCNKSYLT